jgi:hypothetical protein
VNHARTFHSAQRWLGQPETALSTRPEKCCWQEALETRTILFAHVVPVVLARV